MSIWGRVGVEIKDLKAFEMACERMGLEVSFYKGSLHRHSPFSGGRIVASFMERAGGYGTGLLVQDLKVEGIYHLEMDIDPYYNSLVSLADLLGRTYSEMVLCNQVEGMGGFITERVEVEDGGLLLRVMVA